MENLVIYIFLLKTLLEDNKNESGDGGPGQSKSSKRNAVIAGVSVASGAILLATLMIGGTLLATNGSSGMHSQIREQMLVPDILLAGL